MAVDLGNYINEMKDAVNPPGVDLFPGATDDEWTRRMASAFWTAKTQGVTALNAFTETDGILTPIATGAPDVSRDLVQLIILFAAFRAVVNQMSNLKSQFKAQAGNVTFEQQQSATTLKTVLDSLITEKSIVLSRLSDLGTIPTYFTDAVISRDMALRENLVWFVGSS